MSINMHARRRRRLGKATVNPINPGLQTDDIDELDAIDEHDSVIIHFDRVPLPGLGLGPEFCRRPRRRCSCLVGFGFGFSRKGKRWSEGGYWVRSFCFLCGLGHGRGYSIFIGG